MLAGRAPFEGANFPLVAHQIVMGAPAPLSGVSPALQAVLDRALEKDPARRYGSAGELAAAFRKAAGPALSSAPLSGGPAGLSAVPGLGSFGGSLGPARGQREVGRRVHGGRPGPDRLHPARHPPVRRRLRPAPDVPDVPDGRRAPGPARPSPPALVRRPRG